MAMTNIALQAEYFNNIPLLDRRYHASVHLESKKDKVFWDALLQLECPGEYYYIYHSKSEKGKETAGCTQCLKYRNYLSRNFFICIDSDLRILRGEENLDVGHFILQTYTFSWESHYCFAERLQQTWEYKCADIASKFDFSSFIKNFSTVSYPIFLSFLDKMKKGLSRPLLAQLFPNTYSSE